MILSTLFLLLLFYLIFQLIILIGIEIFPIIGWMATIFSIFGLEYQIREHNI